MPVETKASAFTRGGAVRKLVGLITRRPQVQILPPQFSLEFIAREDIELSDVADVYTLNDVMGETTYRYFIAMRQESAQRLKKTKKSLHSPVYHDFKEIVSAPGNSVSRIGPDVRAFIKRAAFALQKYFYGAKVVF